MATVKGEVRVPYQVRVASPAGHPIPPSHYRALPGPA
jgi:hypothetical protein